MKIPTTCIKDILFLTIIFSFFYSFMLGNRPLSAPDEARYVEISREMLSTGDYVTPKLNGIKYFEKPVFFYWLTSLSLKLFGMKEWAMRLVPMILAIIGIISVYFTSYFINGRITGILSSVVLGTNLLYYAMSRFINLDMAVGIFISIALLSFLLSTKEQLNNYKNIFLSIFFSLCAIATLTKGLIGAIIPGTIILLWIIICRKWQHLKLAFCPWGIILFFIIVIPWHILIIYRNPEFAYFYFVQEHFLRYLTVMHGRYQPIWFFAPIVLIGLFPWISFFGQTIKNLCSKKLNPDNIFLLIWIIFIFTFFSLSNSKLISYILPIFPPASIIIGDYLKKIYKEKAPYLFGIYIYITLCIIFSFLSIFVLYDQELIFIKELHLYIILLISVLLGGGIITFLFRNNIKKSFLTILTSNVFFLLILNAAWPMLDRVPIKPIAMVIKKHIKPSDRIVSFSKYYYDLSPYLDRLVTAVGVQGEFKFGMEVEKTQDKVITAQQFWPLWQGEQTIYMVTKKSTYNNLIKENRKPLIVLYEYDDSVLLINKEITK